MMPEQTPLFGQVEGCNWHLRSEAGLDSTADLAGILVINGTKVLYLNRTAYAYISTFLRSKQNHRKTIWQMALRNLITPHMAQQHWHKLYTDLLIASQGCCEGTGIEILGEKQYFTAPLRVDLALTYRCNNDCTHCYAGGSRETAELSTAEWQNIIAKLHTAGVPQVIFTGGESLLRPDLAQLIRTAKEFKMITGLITNGRLLKAERTAELVQAGLDFVQITVESTEAAIHNTMVGFGSNPVAENVTPTDALAETLAGVQNALHSTLRVTTNTTITQLNAHSVLSTVTHLLNLGVERIGVNGIIRAERGVTTDGISVRTMTPLLEEIRILCEKHSAQMIWFTPTCYQQLNPISLGLGVKSCSAASIVLTIEPTGRVLPCQSYFTGLGDARTDSFAQIWNHPLARQLREHTWVQESCHSCSNFSSCGGGCPLEQGCGTKV